MVFFAVQDLEEVVLSSLFIPYSQISPLAQHKFHLMLHCSSTARICSWQLLKASSLAEIIFPKFEISYSIFVCFATFGNGLIIYI